MRIEMPPDKRWLDGSVGLVGNCSDFLIDSELPLRCAVGWTEGSDGNVALALTWRMFG